MGGLRLLAIEANREWRGLEMRMLLERVMKNHGPYCKD